MSAHPREGEFVFVPPAQFSVVSADFDAMPHVVIRLRQEPTPFNFLKKSS